MKILIIRLSSLGDIVLTEPVIGNLTNLYPQSEIFYLVKPAFADVIKGFPESVKIIAWHNDLRSLLQLSRYKFDLVIDLHNKPNTALIRLFCRGKKKVVYDKHHHLRRLIVAHKTKEVISSTVELYFSALRKLNLTPEITEPRLLAKSNQNLIKHDNYIIIFPGATSFTKRWLSSSFAELADLLAGKFQIVIGGSSSEIDICRKIEKNCQAEVINLCGKTSISELISLISYAKGVIANDSGPAHLTAALNIPLVAVFGGTSPKLGFAPMGKKVSIVTKNLDCSPCSLHGLDACPQGHFNCMKRIKVEEIKTVFLKTIKPR